MSQALVIPCFNEAARLPPDEIRTLLRQSDLHIYLVNDGSWDETPLILRKFAIECERVHVLDLKCNQGKGEAIRHGMLAALLDGREWIGYADADFATPAEELLRLLALAQAGLKPVVLGVRVRLRGCRIERSVSRHYLGRLFSTLASHALGLPIYDTQCGAKFFRADERLKASLSKPFFSRWAFDVELLGRLMRQFGNDSYFLEVPLSAWREVQGSKLNLISILKADLDLLVIAIRHRFSS